MCSCCCALVVATVFVAAVLVVDECCASGWTSVFGGQLGMDRISELAQSMGKEQRNVTGDDWVGET